LAGGDIVKYPLVLHVDMLDRHPTACDISTRRKPSTSGVQA
jgi:hypothetical protein